MPDYLLGIDNGGTVAKAAVFDPEGNERAVASRKVRADSPQPGWTEFDMDALWSATAGAVREASERAGIDASEIACVACTGHGNGLYLVDRRGRPVRPAIYSSDNRARQYIERWQADGVDVAVRPKTMQSIWPAQPNALLAWLRDHEPESIARADAVLMCKDFIRLRLTGQLAMELTDMSATSLMNVGTRQYDASVLEAFGIADMERLLPPLVRSTEICGQVTAEAAEATGLKEGTPVAGGMFDIDACGLASGMVDSSQLCLVVGTWGNNQYIAPVPVVDADVFMTSCYAIDGQYLMLEGSPTSASNLEWLVTQFFEAEAREAEAAGESIYHRCNRLVAETRPEQSGVVFLPFLYGSNVGPDAKACLFGLDGWQRRGHVLRAVYEGVVFAHRWHIERLLRFRDPPQRIRLTGGAARSDAWMQIFADVLGAPVEIPAGTELGALGAAICASVAAGLHTDYAAACARMVRVARTYPPDVGRADLYSAKYARYQQLIATLAPVWGKLAWRR